MTEAVIFDCGSGFTKIGYTGDKAPSAVFPTIVGRPKNGGKSLRAAVGNVALNQDRRVADVVYPIQNGVITDWEAMESVWEYVMLTHMSTAVEDTPLLMSENPQNSKKIRERILEIIFETYKPPSVYLALKPVLSLYAHGKTSGCVLQSGDDVTHALCVKDGYAISGTVVRSMVGGRRATEHMKQALVGRSPEGAIGDERSRLLKERAGCVSANIGAESDVTTAPFTLPDGQIVELGKERFTCAEYNFNPQCIGASGAGFVRCITDSINLCTDVGAKRGMYENILLSGGNTMYRNTKSRLCSDLEKNLSGHSANVSVDAPLNRKHYAWVGGSVISSLSTFRDMWITEKDYRENGASIVHRMCPFYANA